MGSVQKSESKEAPKESGKADGGGIKMGRINRGKGDVGCQFVYTPFPVPVHSTCVETGLCDLVRQRSLKSTWKSFVTVSRRFAEARILLGDPWFVIGVFRTRCDGWSC